MKKVIQIFVTISIIAFLFSACTTQKHIVQSTEPLSSINVQQFTPPVATTPVLKLPNAIQPKPTTPNKSNFEVSYQILKNMMQGNEPPNFEYAVYVSENPYHNNKYTYEQFQQTLDIPLYCIERLIKANDKSDTMNFDAHVGANGRFKMADMRFLPKEKKELYRKALTNWAIFKYLTDTTLIDPFYNEPYTYITKDPFGKNDWANSQVIHLLTSDEQKGNCFALTALYKILADRLNADAKLCTAPQHIYIQHRDTKGDYYNVELATAGFPDDGTIQALTYTTNDALMNKIALRDYTEKQSIGICMVNLAKSYEHTFNTKDDSFMLKCAETVLQYDSLNLSALLLKQVVLDNSVINYAQKTNNNNLLSLKKDKNIQPTINDLEKHVALLYRLGYRQMPLDMQQIILSGNYPTEFTDKNPSPFTSIDAKDAKTAHYHALFGGMFKEVFIEQPTENYGHFVFDTKTKKLQTVDIKAQENELVDPVAFAYDFGERMYDARLGKFLSTDPLANKYPIWSPYSAFANNPILFIDPDGREVVWATRFQTSNQFKPIIAALNKSDVYKSIFSRFIKNQDNVFMKSTSGVTPHGTYFGYADPNRGTNGYDLNIGYYGFMTGGYLTADATFIAKVIMHEGLHQRYTMAKAEGKQSDYPTLNKNMNAELNDPTGNYEGDHEAMAEGNVTTFVTGMKQFDAAYGTTHSEDWYNAMAWNGSLMRTDDWKNMEAGQKAKYQALMTNEDNYMNYLDARANYMKSKSSADKTTMDSAKKNVDWKLFKKSRTK